MASAFRSRSTSAGLGLGVEEEAAPIECASRLVKMMKSTISKFPLYCQQDIQGDTVDTIATVSSWTGWKPKNNCHKARAALEGSAEPFAGSVSGGDSVGGAWVTGGVISEGGGATTSLGPGSSPFLGPGSSWPLWPAASSLLPSSDSPSSYSSGSPWMTDAWVGRLPKCKLTHHGCGFETEWFVLRGPNPTKENILFTPLRVGWPPTPQVYFGLWEGLRVVWNMRSRAAQENPGCPGPRFPPPGSFQWVLLSLFPPVEASQAREFSLFPPMGASQATEFSLFPHEASQAREFSLSPPVGAPQAREFSLFPPGGASQAREFSLFPAVTASQAMEFSLFPPLEALQAAEFQIARQRRLDSPPNPVFFECVSIFCNGFLQSTVLYTFVAIKPVENIMFDNGSNSLISPTVENTAIYSVFFNFSMFQCR